MAERDKAPQAHIVDLGEALKRSMSDRPHVLLNGVPVLECTKTEKGRMASMAEECSGCLRLKVWLPRADCPTPAQHRSQVDSIGTCALCGYHGPGPSHDCNSQIKFSVCSAEEGERNFEAARKNADRVIEVELNAADMPSHVMLAITARPYIIQRIIEASDPEEAIATIAADMAEQGKSYQEAIVEIALALAHHVRET